MVKCVGFDIEVANVLRNFSAWKDYRPLVLTCIGLAPSDGEAIAYYNPEGYITRNQAIEVVLKLQWYVHKDYKIVTWNGLGFDWVLLSDTSGMKDECRNIAMSAQHVDIMFNMFMALGYGVGLGTACQETLGKGKLMSGKEAPKEWKDGDRLQVLEYVKEDARLTIELYQYLLTQARPLIKWRTRKGYGNLKQMRAGPDWNQTWSVKSTLNLTGPPPLAHFMTDPPTLTDYLGEWNSE